MVRQKSHIRLVERPSAPQQRKRVNLFDHAYERIEELLVNGALRPGRFLTMQDLQDVTGFGRTPVHHAVNRLAADTLIVIRPRHGLQIAPVNLARERLLLQLRRDMERFVVRLATERADAAQREQLLGLERLLASGEGTDSLAAFNVVDREIDRLILSAAREPFLEHSLRPLHTLFRRIGYIHHSRVPGRTNLSDTVDCHRAVMIAIVNGHAAKAAAASDALIDYVDGMFEALAHEIEPALLDCSVDVNTGRLAASGSPISPVVRTGLQQQPHA